MVTETVYLSLYSKAHVTCLFATLSCGQVSCEQRVQKNTPTPFLCDLFLFLDCTSDVRIGLLADVLIEHRANICIDIKYEGEAPVD